MQGADGDAKLMPSDACTDAFMFAAAANPPNAALTVGSAAAAADAFAAKAALSAALNAALAAN